MPHDSYTLSFSEAALEQYGTPTLFGVRFEGVNRAGRVAVSRTAGFMAHRDLVVAEGALLDLTEGLAALPATEYEDFRKMCNDVVTTCRGFREQLAVTPPSVIDKYDRLFGRCFSNPDDVAVRHDLMHFVATANISAEASTLLEQYIKLARLHLPTSPEFRTRIDIQWHSGAVFWDLLKEDFDRSVYLAAHGFEPRNFYNSTNDRGPRYNAVNPYTQLPILGDWLNATSELDVTDAVGYVPPPGVVAVVSVTGRPDGTIGFSTIGATDRPALLLPQDFDVLIALAFLEDKIPQLSMDTGETDFSIVFTQSVGVEPFKAHDMSVKVWAPAWLQVTEVGKTLYTTDTELGQFAFTGFNLSCVSEQNERMTGLSQLGSTFAAAIQEIRDTKPQSPYSISSRSVRVEGAASLMDHLQVAKDASGKITVVIPHLPLRAMHCFRVRDSEPTLEHFVNSDKDRGGAICNYITEHFDEFATLLPEYERLRQLFGTYAALRALRDDPGFVLDTSIRKELELKVEGWCFTQLLQPPIARLVRNG